MADYDWETIELLVEKAGRGQDRSAFDELAGYVKELGLRFALKRYGGTLTPEDAEDVLMYALATAWQKLPSLEKPRAFVGWFLRILARKCVAACRLKAVSLIIGPGDEAQLDSLVLATPELAEEIGIANSRGDPYGHLVQMELVASSKARIMKVYRNLTEIQQRVFAARILNLFDEAQTKKKTQLPIGTIRSASRKIFRMLRKEFEGTEFRDVPPQQRKIAFLEALASWQQESAGGLA